MKIKIFLVIAAIVGVLAAAVILFLDMNSRPISKKDFAGTLERKLISTVEKEHITSAVVTVYSEKRGIDLTFAAGMTGEAQDIPVEADQPYHIASIGKVFTATIIGILHDRGALSYNDDITNFLSGDFLEGLFVYEGTDYSSDVTISHLLSHTSGINDYFDGPVNSGENMLSLVLSNQDKMWTPEELVAFTRDRQSAVGKPGQKMFYSDTGYILLGLIVEEVTGRPFHEYLHEMILEPLAMDDTYMMFLSEPVNKPGKAILEFWLNGENLSRSNALSVDWTGGGIISTSGDLLKFSKALHGRRLLDHDTYEYLRSCEYKRFNGLYYGYGMMEFRFGEFFFLLDNLPLLSGGIGVTTTYMLYDWQSDTHFIANYGSADFMEKGIRQLIDFLMLYNRVRG